MKIPNPKSQIPNLLILLLGLLSLSKQAEGQVGIGTTTPDASSILDMVSTSQGVLVSRISLTDTADVTTIATPATNLLVFNTNAAMTGGNGTGFYYYNGSKWVYMIAPVNSPATSGQVLTSQGTGTGPSWVSQCSNAAVPAAQWPTFDANSPYVLLGALWVGYDVTSGCWKYNKQASGRGLTDPGNPNTWTVNGTTIDFFNGNKNDLPPGTHINFRYDPSTMAFKHSQDDIMVRTGSFWIDKYESRIIDVSTTIWQDNDDNTLLTPPDNDIRGNAHGIPPTWMVFSQKNRGSTGMSWFVAQKAAANAGKKIASNAEW